MQMQNGEKVKRMAEYIVNPDDEHLFYGDKYEELIRCKDCKHRRADTVYSYCEKLYRMGASDTYCYMTSEDDFCSMAERKGEKNEHTN